MISPQTTRALEHGRELFNARRYFEAHEVWEAAWLTESGSCRRTLQGLIQIAASLLKARRSESPGGSLRLLDEGLEKLEGTSPEDAGSLDLTALRADLARFRPLLVAWTQGDSETVPDEAFPRLGGG